MGAGVEIPERKRAQQIRTSQTKRAGTTAQVRQEQKLDRQKRLEKSVGDLHRQKGLCVDGRKRVRILKDAV